MQKKLAQSTVEAAETALRKIALLFACPLLCWGCAAHFSRRGGSADVAAPPALVSVAVTPGNPMTKAGVALQFIAKGTFNDGTTQDITTSVVWSSSSPGVSTISNDPSSQGRARAVAGGATTIKATTGSVTGTTNLTVASTKLDGISLGQSRASIPQRTSARFSAIGNYDDGSTQDLTDSVDWASLDPKVAIISNNDGSRGLATGASGGCTTIDASVEFNGALANLCVTSGSPVVMTVVPNRLSLPADVYHPAGTTEQFRATATYLDGTSSVAKFVNWYSSDPTVANVGNSPNGFVTALSPGPTNITATDGGVSGLGYMVVTPNPLQTISVSPSNSSMAAGTGSQFTATGHFSDGNTTDLTMLVSWNSSNPNVATIVSTGGRATTTGPGITTISAQLNNVSGSTKLSVVPARLVGISLNPTSPTADVGTTEQFTAMGLFTPPVTGDITSQVTWSSSNPAVAPICKDFATQGCFSALAVGTATITAGVGVISAATTLTISTPTLSSIVVTPPSPSLRPGMTRQFEATGTLSDGTTINLTRSGGRGIAPVVWNVSNSAVAVFSDAGLVFAERSGTATITAELTTQSGKISGSSSLTISTLPLVSLAVRSASQSVAKGMAEQIQAIGTLSDGTTQDLTELVNWTSSDPKKVIISNTQGGKGLATSLGLGTATITAKSDALSSSSDLMVTPSRLLGIVISPADSTIERGMRQQFTATGTYTDGTTQDVTTLVTWSSNDANVAIISNTLGDQGGVSGVSIGNTVITATLGPYNASARLAVVMGPPPP